MKYESIPVYFCNSPQTVPEVDLPCVSGTHRLVPVLVQVQRTLENKRSR